MTWGREARGRNRLGNEVVMPGEPRFKERGPEGREMVCTWDWRPRGV